LAKSSWQEAVGKEQLAKSSWQEAVGKIQNSSHNEIKNIMARVL
jgi:hypothetical protein